MPANASALKFLRQIHLYFGLLISPALLFFAFTGAVQTLSLHEAAGSSYKPPAILAVWGQIHKKQTWVLPARRPPARDDRHEGSGNAAGSPVTSGTPSHPDSTGARSGLGPQKRDDSPKFSAALPTNNPNGAAAAQPSVTLASKQKQHLPLKLFFLVVSLGLFSSTLTGIYMAYKYDRNKLLVSGLLLAGIVLPLVLLPF